MPSSWTQNYYHMVFSTKEREPLLDPVWHDRLYAFFGGTARDLRAQLLAGNGMPDHVHLLLRFPADLAPAVLAREVKSRSSKWIHETFKGKRSFAWQRGYGGFTVSTSNVPQVEKYILDQAIKHRRMTFREEFIALLDKNKVEYDPRYVFE
jgi:putative transposase